MQGKKVTESEVIMLHLPMPDETNAAGSIHGGHLLKHIDNAGGIAACRHARAHVVTAFLDRMDFLTPVHPGELIIFKASVNAVGRTSIEVGVRVEVEDMTTGSTRHTATCYLTYVALDELRKPKEVPPLILETDIERERHGKALQRRQLRQNREKTRPAG
ncbi:MAG: acyl-CoA thioesterase [Deltaproteobacteria bacterium]|nr:acyl-CoA thioesterase [Deltaproteobacteria bacterium]